MQSFTALNMAFSGRRLYHNQCMNHGSSRTYSWTPPQLTPLSTVALYQISQISTQPRYFIKRSWATACQCRRCCASHLNSAQYKAGNSALIQLGETICLGRRWLFPRRPPSLSPSKDNRRSAILLGIATRLHGNVKPTVRWLDPSLISLCR